MFAMLSPLRIDRRCASGRELVAALALLLNAASPSSASLQHSPVLAAIAAGPGETRPEAMPVLAPCSRAPACGASVSPGRPASIRFALRPPSRSRRGRRREAFGTSPRI